MNDLNKTKPELIKELQELRKSHEALKASSEKDKSVSNESEEKSRLNEKLYRSVYDNMLNGVAYCRMIYENDHPIDFIYLNVNRAFESVTGLTKVKGRKVSEVIPDILKTDFQLIELYSRVALTGAAETFEVFVKALNMWFFIAVYSPKKGYFIAIFDVITERKKTEASIRESEEKYRNLFNNSEVGMFRTKLDGSEILEFNEKYLKILNYTSEDVIDKPSASIWADKREREEMVKMLNIEGHVTDFECGIMNKQGEVRRCLTSIKLYRDTGILEGSIQDITERKKIEESIRESEENFRSIFENNSAAMAIIEPDTTFSMVNDEYCRISGYTKKEMIGMSWTQQIPPADLERLKENNRRRLINPKDAPNKYELTYYHKNGEIRHALMSITTLHNRKFIASFIDITIRKQAEEQLQKNEERFRHISSTISDISYSCVKDQQGNYSIDWMAGASEHITGYSLDEIKAFNCWGQLVVDEDQDTFKENVTSLSHGSSSTCELRLKHKNGKIVWVTSYAECVKSQDQSEYFHIYGGLVDITERKIAEAELKESEEKYRVLFNGSSNGILTIDIEADQCVFSNPAACKLFGYTSEEFTKLSLANLHPKESLDYVLSEFESQNSGKKSISLALPCLRKDGTIFYADISGSPITINGRNCSVGFIADATERKKAEELLLVSEEKYRLLADSSPEMIYLIDSEGYIQYVNSAAAASLNLEINNVTGKHLREIFPSKIATSHLKAIKEVFESQKKQFKEIEDEFPNGKLWITVQLAPVINNKGEVMAVLGLSNDITDRKKAEELLRISEDRFRSLYENSTIGLYRTTPEGKIILCNPTLLKMLGYNSIDEVNSRDIVNEGYNPTYVRQEFKQMMESNGIVTGLEAFWKRKDGSLIYLSESARAIRDQHGNIIYYDGTVEDVSERHKAQEELIAAKDKAEESDRLKSAFLANMSHEIRTPMNGILGFSELLKEPNLTIEEQEKYIKIIQNSGTHLLNIINDIIDISKIESGQMETMIEDTNVNELIESLFNFFKPQTEQNGINFSYKESLSSASACIKTDRKKLNAILINLVNNAIKFTPSGSIEIGYVLKDLFLEVFVKDTGIGVNQANKEIIFDRFRQGDKLSTKSYEGSGLGLSISKAYVEMLGGRIWVESERGKGSTFYFTIPYRAGPTGIITNNVSSEVGKDNQVKTLRILIVEDDETSVLLLKTALKNYCKEILIAATGTEAIDTCRNNPDINFILMDIRMPDMDGYEATHHIRQFNKDVIIFAQTAHAMAGDREKAINAGCNEYMAKPIKIDVLKGLLRKYFKQ